MNGKAGELFPRMKIYTQSKKDEKRKIKKDDKSRGFYWITWVPQKTQQFKWRYITFPRTKQHAFLDWKHYRNAQKNSCKRSTSNCIILKFQNAKNIKKKILTYSREGKISHEELRILMLKQGEILP